MIYYMLYFDDVDSEKLYLNYKYLPLNKAKRLIWNSSGPLDNFGQPAREV